MTRIMQIGAGRWGTNHLRVLSNLPVDLYVAETSETERAKCLQEGIREDRVTDDYRSFLNIVSAVVVVTPAPTHFALCQEVLEMGKDVFVEKPVAETTAQAEELAALAHQTKAVFQVGHIFRYDPATEFVKGYLDSGQLGVVRALTGNFSGFKRPRADGGVTISDAIHFIDYFHYLMGEVPKRVLARCHDLLARGMDDMAWVWMDYGDTLAMVEADCFSPEKKRLITIIGDRATLVCNFLSSQDKIVIYGNQHILDNGSWKSVGGEIIRKEVPLTEPLSLELDDFLHCIQTRLTPKADAQAGIDSLKVVEAALRSHREGDVVTVTPTERAKVEGGTDNTGTLQGRELFAQEPRVYADGRS